jgi:hypothetical protein
MALFTQARYGALSHAQRVGSVYKAAGWSTRNSASLSCGCNGVSIDSKISTDRPTRQRCSRQTANPSEEPARSNRQQAVHRWSIRVTRQTVGRSYTRLPTVQTRHDTGPVKHQQLMMWGRYPPIDTSPHTFLLA